MKIALGCVFVTNVYPDEVFAKFVSGIDRIEVGECVRVYSNPDGNMVVGELCPEDVIQRFYILERVEVGIGIVETIPEGGEGLIEGERVFILDYVGEGRSRVLYDNRQYISKVPRKPNCLDNYNRNYCWLELIKEPIVSTWVYVESETDVGWINSGIEYYSDNEH